MKDIYDMAIVKALQHVNKHWGTAGDPQADSPTSSDSSQEPDWDLNFVLPLSRATDKNGIPLEGNSLFPADPRKPLTLILSPKPTSQTPEKVTFPPVLSNLHRLQQENLSQELDKARQDLKASQSIKKKKKKSSKTTSPVPVSPVSPVSSPPNMTLDAVFARLSQMEGELAANRLERGTHKERIQHLDRELAVNQRELAVNQRELAANQRELAANRLELADNRLERATHKERIQHLDRELAANRLKTATHEEELVAHMRKIQSLEGIVSTQQEQIQSLLDAANRVNNIKIRAIQDRGRNALIATLYPDPPNRPTWSNFSRQYPQHSVQQHPSFKASPDWNPKTKKTPIEVKWLYRDDLRAQGNKDAHVFTDDELSEAIDAMEFSQRPAFRSYLSMK
ncbi:hypothetical protein DACRYDRAFT_115902 [Dacryopinax primogenitus]|uniref:Uncharacterized protein n=1 Tax=Dacryopinax primogenitus (strain DJM 731) TaxID=1858805 RepID=M5G8C4_DACPD|nr:uncharacterized protein DACRYDRAFT_115902 [Dacryopinax primogenitus]EJU02112.1 hypothetical protein DACRYDRAFT_115902 [Dacryopinax primogenitus]